MLGGTPTSVMVDLLPPIDFTAKSDEVDDYRNVTDRQLVSDKLSFNFQGRLNLQVATAGNMGT
jgi:hypothetical protein